MKKLFLKFVQKNWVKSEYANVVWDKQENVGIVYFYDGTEAIFEYKDGDFIQIEN